MSNILKHKVTENILLLQGPVGYFFSDLHNHLIENGAKKVVKINYNMGDDFFYRHPNIICFNQPFHQLEQFYKDIIHKHTITSVYLFGDCRYIHKVAIAVLKQLHIPVYVFEEGYIRPHYITLEEGGVNGYSKHIFKSMRDIPEIKTITPPCKGLNKKSLHGYGSFRSMVFFGFIYFSLCRIFKNRYPFYLHHKSVSPFEILIWLRSFVKKYSFKLPDYRFQRKLLKEQYKNFYFVPLQVFNDAQVFNHSQFHDIIDFIDTVLVSFAENAPKDTFLVIKHHPLDRGHRNYKQFIKQRKKQLGIKKRVFYVHEVSLPKMLKTAKAVITINSTVGLSALYHQTPVKVLGKAIYDIGGLTYQGCLDNFWKSPGRVNMNNYSKFKLYLLNNTQIFGSFYRKLF